MCKKGKKLEILCQVCSDREIKSFMQPTGLLFLTCPQKRIYKCSKCGYKEIVEEKVKNNEKEKID